MTAAEDLQRLADAYWEATLEASPLFASIVGDRRYDDRLPDESDAGVARARDRLARLDDAAAAIDGEMLSEADRVTSAALLEGIRGDLAVIDSGLHRWTVDPLEGLVANLLALPDYQRLETPDDGARMVARYRAVGPAVDTYAGNLRASRAHGSVAPRAPVAHVIDALDTLLASPDAGWPLSRPASDEATAAWPASDRETFGRRLGESIANDVRPAFVRLRDVLTNEIAPVARGDDAVGIGALSGGADAYRSLIRRHTSLELTPDELHQTGLAEVDRIDRELRELTGRVLGASSLPEALASLRSDPALHFGTRDEVQDVAERSLARANEAIPDWFGRLPRAPCVVVRMGTHEEAHNTIAYYREPAADGSRPGQFAINTGAPETRPRYEAEALAFHEAVPGHHLQLAIAGELDDLPMFRRWLGPTAYIEGWGLYTERLSDEMGLYTGDLDRIGVLSFDAWRACRLVVDTGMHALGWSRDQAITFMTEHTALAANNIANEIDRYIVWPGQALGYKAGQLELVRLRTRAHERLGARFEIRAFHDAVLGQGALPLSTLAAVVDRWVAAQAG
jgi:uncharacterized protein (DUF885 family)